MEDDIVRIQNISELHSILGYRKPSHPLISLIDFSKLELTDEYETRRVVTGFYTIMLKNHVHGKIKYGREYYDFQEGTLIFIAPEQVITMEADEEYEGKAEGWGLFFHPDLLRKSGLAERMKEYTFFSYDLNEGLHLSERERETVTSIVEKIESEYSMNIDEFSHSLIVSNLELLLNYCRRFYGRQFITREHRNRDVVKKLERFLQDYISSDKLKEAGIPTVKYCAEQMFLSPNYLSDLLKRETGKNTQEHIHYYLIERAKNKLLGSSASINEIAYELGFEYPQYFSKLFKTKTGFSPADYRKQG